MAGTFDDIRPPRGRIPRKAPRRPEEKPVGGIEKEHTEAPLPKNPDIPSRSFSASKLPKYHSRIKWGGFSRIALWSIAVAAVLFLVFAFSGLFVGAVIKVTPRQESSLIDGVFTATNGDDLGSLSFDVMIISRETSIEISATEEQHVDRKASGEIIIYNSYSSASQRLIKNTRFPCSEGTSNASSVIRSL